MLLGTVITTLYRQDIESQVNVDKSRRRTDNPEGSLTNFFSSENNNNICRKYPVRLTSLHLYHLE